MKILITGANGFVGASLCRYFSGKGHEILATGRQEKPHPHLLSYATYFPADISAKFDPVDADVCIHAAGLASDTETYKNLYSNNVIGTENVLEASNNCKHIVYISSSSVYDFSGGTASESSANLNAGINDYGKTKLMAESLVQSNIPSHQTRLILRPRAIYGIGDRVLLPRLLKMIKGGTVLCPVADHIKTSATHIDNLAYAINLYLNQEGKPKCQVLNVADDCLYKLKDIILNTLEAVEGRKLRAINVSKLLPLIADKIQISKEISPIALKALSGNAVLDLTQIKASLNYDPPVNFYDSYLDIGNWVQNLGGKQAYLRNLKEVPWLHN